MGAAEIRESPILGRSEAGILWETQQSCDHRSYSRRSPEALQGTSCITLPSENIWASVERIKFRWGCTRILTVSHFADLFELSTEKIQRAKGFDSRPNLQRCASIAKFRVARPTREIQIETVEKKKNQRFFNSLWPNVSSVSGSYMGPRLWKDNCGVHENFLSRLLLTSLALFLAIAYCVCDKIYCFSYWIYVNKESRTRHFLSGPRVSEKFALRCSYIQNRFGLSSGYSDINQTPKGIHLLI